MDGKGGDGMKDDTISRKKALDTVKAMCDRCDTGDLRDYRDLMIEAFEALPSAQPPKEIPKRVLWTGWKGYRYTRYKCPNCEMPVRNDDAYCHRCGQRLMFPKISFTPYIPGQKQDVIARWGDEG